MIKDDSHVLPHWFISVFRSVISPHVRLQSVGGLAGGCGARWLSQTRPIPRSPDGDNNRDRSVPDGSDEKSPCMILDDMAHLMEVLVCPNPMCIQRKL